MKTELIYTLTETFEAHAQQTEGGIEYWLARDLKHLFCYTEWRNFIAVISKAKTACDVSGHAPQDHFVDVNKMISMPKDAEKEAMKYLTDRGLTADTIKQWQIGFAPIEFHFLHHALLRQWENRITIRIFVATDKAPLCLAAEHDL